MNNSAKYLPFLAIFLLLGLVSAQGNWQTNNNFNNYINVSNVNYTATFNGLKVQTGYTYVPFPSNVAFYTLTNSVVIEGFTASNIFIGNITAFTWNNGWLIRNTTINGNAWQRATIFYGYEGLPINANYYLINDMNTNTTYYSGNPIEDIVVYGTHDSSLMSPYSASWINNGTTGYLSLGYGLGYPYLLVPSNNAYCNYSMSQTNSYSALALHLITLQNDYPYAANMIVHGTFSSNAIYSSTSNYTIYIGSAVYVGGLPYAYGLAYAYSKYLLLGNGYGVYSNGLAFNSITSSFLSGVFYQSAPYITKFYYGNLLTYGGIFPQIAYYLIPAYSTNSFIASNVPIAVNPSNPPNTTFSYECPVNSISWTYNSLSYANGSATRPPIKTSIGASKVGYLLLNMSYQLGMGANCTNLNLFNGKSPIPFALNKCNSSAVSLIVSNHSFNGANFASLEVEYGIKTSINGYSNSTVKDNWLIYQGANAILPLSTDVPPYLIQLAQPLNINSYVSVNDVRGNIAEIYNPSGILAAWTGGFTVNSISGDTNTTILVTTNSTASIIMQMMNIAVKEKALSDQFFIYNYSTYVFTSDYNPVDIRINLVGGNMANVTKLYTDQYKLGNCTVIPTTPKPLPISNSSPNIPALINNGTLSLGNYNAKMSLLNLNSNVNISGISVPSLDIFIIALILSLFFIIGGAVANSPAPIIFGFVIMWFVGLFNAVATSSVTSLIIVVLITAVFAVYEVVKHHKQG